ncbi:MAG: hypothetical protein WC965_06015 [Thiohalomonadaceae bacterium]
MGSLAAALVVTVPAARAAAEIATEASFLFIVTPFLGYGEKLNLAQGNWI